MTYEWLFEQYVVLQRSTYDIARELDVYPNIVRRALLRLGIGLRDHSEAQRAAILSGRARHPTSGRTHDPQTRARIGDSLAQAWQEMSDEERERRVEMGRDQWERTEEADRKKLLRLAGEAIRKSAREGSRLERFLADSLAGLGHEVCFHTKIGCVQVDLFLPSLSVAIEVLGPGHYLPVWGAERLASVLAEDDRKAGLLVKGGVKLLRIKNLSKTLSDYQMRTVLAEVVASLTTSGPSVLELEVKS